MSNGAQCCALEICCPPEQVRAKLPAMVSKHANATVDEATLGHLLDFMAAEGLTFAPWSFRQVVQDIVTSERNRVAHKGAAK